LGFRNTIPWELTDGYLCGKAQVWVAGAVALDRVRIGPFKALLER
jgi:hypothetical protein